MKKLFVILIAAVMLLSLAACNNEKEPEFDDAQKQIEDIQDSDDKDTIEKNIKDVFGVKISLPKADSYSASTVSGDGSSIYLVTMEGASLTAEELFDQLSSTFSSWTATESVLTYSKETDSVLYGAVIAKEGDYLTIAFSITDQELIGSFTSDIDSFYSEIKKLSGIKLDLSTVVTSVGFPDTSSDGAKVNYGGMLLSGGGNLDESGFDAVADLLDKQLTGYTKEEPDTTTWGAAKILRWVDNSDQTCFFELELFDFEGVQYVNLHYHYTDRSLLSAWPFEQINGFFGKDAGIPQFSGNYRDLQVYEFINEDDEYSDYADHIEINLSGTEEEECNAWIAALESHGFVRSEDDWGNVRYYKDLGGGLYVNMKTYRETYGGAFEITLEKEQLDGLEWPAAQIEEKYGSGFASMLPAVPQATRRTFTVSNDTIYIRNNFDSAAFNAYCDALMSAGFTETSRDEIYAKYSYSFENYDKVTVSVSFEIDNSSVYVDYEKYEGPGFTLPENALIEYTFAYPSDPEDFSSFKIVKIGENYHFSGGIFGSYYEYDEASKVWYKYTSITIGETSEWTKGEEALDRYAVDRALKNSMSYLFFEKASHHEEDASRNKTVHGFSCTAYTAGSYTYWVSDDTGLLFEQDGIFLVKVTAYDTSIRSFEDAGITADMMPGE